MPQTTSVFGTAGVTRAWTDANQNFVPDCDLLNPAAQDLRASGGDLCGVMSNTSFGRNVLTNNFDPGMLDGWGVRPSDWNRRGLDSAADRHAIATRRDRTPAGGLHGFLVADNRALQPSDLTPFSIAAPADPRLPGGGGYVVSGVYDVVPAKSGQVNNLVDNADQYGSWSQSFNGVDVTAHVRLGSPLVLVGGSSSGADGRRQLRRCASGCRNSPPRRRGRAPFGAGLNGSTVSPVSPYCHAAYGWLTQVRGLTSYVVPKAEVELSATFQSKPGAMLSANYAAPNSVVAPSLGRNLPAMRPTSRSISWRPVRCTASASTSSMSARARR